MNKLQVIIPMAGIGKRMGPLTRHTPKALLRLTDRRLLAHVLSTFEELEKAYSLDYIFIVGHMGEQIRSYMRETYPHKSVVYAVQEQPRGQSHAVSLARDAVSGPVLLTYCDTINFVDFSFLSLGNVDGAASVHEVDDPRRHGVAIVGPDKLITKFIEKPKTMGHTAALTGLYYFSDGKELIAAIETQMRKDISLNNEYYLADAINILLEAGMRIRAEHVLQWIDAGTPEALIQANASLLQRQAASPVEPVPTQSTALIHPVYIHKSSRVESSIIGPNVSIGQNCSIQRSIIRDTIIDDNASVNDVTLTNSFVDRGCFVSGSSMQAITTDYDGTKIYCAAA